mgnify:CR=1 FL=1
MAKISKSILDAVNTDKFNTGTKKETLINPDTVPSGATAKPADNTASGTKQVTAAKYGRKGNDPVPGPDLPEARPCLFADQKKAEENLDMLAIVNNKRKSLARAKYIINVDFNEEEISTYCINRNAVIFNQSQNKIKNIIGFQGMIINNIKIKEENCKYPIELEYEKYKAEIIKKIYNGEYILIGNNGKIDKKEI